jgi:hypothetical protein
LALLGGGLAADRQLRASNGIYAPKVGAQYDYLCRNAGTVDRTMEWDILGVSDGLVQVGESIDGEVFWREVPAELFGTTLSHRRLAVDGQRRMETGGASLAASGVFARLAALSVGDTATAEVIEHMGQGGVVPWQYELTVEKAGKTEHDLLGEPDVVILNEARSHGFYESRRKVFYAPEIRGPLGFNYADTFGNDERCILSAYREPGEAAPRLQPTIIGLGGE